MSVFDRIAKDDLIQNTLNVINKTACCFIKDQPDMFSKALDVIVEAFESEIGLMAIVDERGDLVVEAMHGAVLEECTLYDINKVRFPKDEWKGIWGHALTSKEILFKNDSNFTTPDGHVLVKRALLAPILYEDKVIGNIVLGNRKKDYTEDDRDLLKALCIHLAPILKAKVDVDKQKAETSVFQKAIWDMLNYANMYVLLLDNEMRIKLINYSLAKKMGFNNEDEPLNKCWIDFLEPKDREWIKAIHHSITFSTKEARKYREVYNHIVGLDGSKFEVKWFNAMINHNYEFSFSMGIPVEEEHSAEMTEESIRSFYRDVIEKDKVMIRALKDMMNLSHPAACAAEEIMKET
jgi:hypothetical protein